MSRIVYVALAIVLPCTLWAQKSPKVSAQIVLGFHEQVQSAALYGMRIQSSVSTEADPYYVNQTNFAGLATSVQSPNAIAKIYPGRLYTYSTGSALWNGGDIQFNVPPGYTMYMGLPYEPMVPHTTIATPNYAGGSTTFQIWFYVIPSDGAPFLAPGYARPPRISDVTWSVSAGTLASGTSAGVLRWQSTGLNQNLLNASSLIYTPPLPTANAGVATYVPSADIIGTYYYPDGTIKFISTLNSQIYIRENIPATSGYTIEVYQQGVTYSWPSNNPVNDWQFNTSPAVNTPSVSYVVSNPNASINQIQIVQTTYASQGNSVENWLIGPGPLGVTQVQRTNADQIITTTSFSITGGREEQITTTDNTPAKTPAKYEEKFYTNYSWGEELAKDILDPNDMEVSGVGLALTTKYNYVDWVTPGVYTGNYSKLQSVANADGSWVAYDYYDDFSRWGEAAHIYSSWQDFAGNPLLPAAASSKMTTFNYAGERGVYQELPSLSQTSITGIETASTVISSTLWATNNYTGTMGNQPMRTDTIVQSSSSTSSLTTIRSVFHNEADPVYNGKLYSQKNPDGTMTSASYWTGTCFSWLPSSNWNATYFAPSVCNNWCENYLTGTAAKQDVNATQFTTDGVTGGKAIDPIWMTPYRSFRRQIEKDTNGKPIYDVTEVWTGTVFQIISWTQTYYDWQGLLGSSQTSKGELTNCTRINGQINYQTNPDGTQTQYFFDSMMRVTQAETKGVAAASPYAAQAAIETYYGYDGLGHVLSTTKTSASGGPALTTSSTYNMAGLPKTQTDARGLVTTFAYSGTALNVCNVVTTTNPDGSTKIVTNHLDGTLSSITGNAQVNQFQASAPNADGTITTNSFLGTSSSFRWTSAQADWLGRTIAEKHPTFGQQIAPGSTSPAPGFVKQSYYNSLGQLSKTTQTGMAATLYEYDPLGELQYSGLAIEGGSSLDLGGTDRVTQTRTLIVNQTVNQESAWWRQTITSVYNQTNSTAAAITSQKYEKLVPYDYTNGNFIAGTAISEVDAFDSFGNLTTEKKVSTRSAGFVVDTTTFPNSTQSAVTVNYNGLLVGTQNQQNIFANYGYDGLDRQVSVTDARRGTSTTAYFASGAGKNGQIQSQTDAAGNTTTFAYDPTSGRLSSQTDPAGTVSDPIGYVVYHGYDHAGREIKTWGNGTYPVESAYDIYGSKIAMRTFRSASLNFSGTAWPLSDDGTDPLNPNPNSWANGDVTSWVFDPGSGLLTKKTDAAGKNVSYGYNPNGTLSTRAWARGVTTTYTYDPNTAEQTRIAYSDGVTPSVAYTFDRLGHGLTVAQAYSSFTLSTNLAYNLPGKLTQEIFDPTYFGGLELNYQLDTTNPGTQGRITGYELGISGALTQDGAVTFGYDNYGRFNSEALSGGPSFAYNYSIPYSNLLGSVTDSADNWSQARTWEANRDLLTSIQTSVGSTLEGAYSYIYDPIARRTSKVQTGAMYSRYPAGGITDSYLYDSYSQVLSDQAWQSTNPAAPTNAVIGRKFAFTYDPIGNRLSSAIDTQPSSVYTPNSLNQISSRTVPGYYPVSGFAASGASVTVNGAAIPMAQFQGQYFLQNYNVTNTTLPVWASATVASSLGGSFAMNAFVPKTAENYSYDADGNILTDGRWNYFWDAENRLAAIETYGNQKGNTLGVWNSGVPRIHIDFLYDYQGRRISKKISNWNGTAFVLASETRFVYENWNVIADYIALGNTLTFSHLYVWGLDMTGKRHASGGVGGLLAFMTGTGTIELPIYDANGNVQGLTDRLTGQITAAYEYSIYGETLRAYGQDALMNPFRFSSKITDDEDHLLNYGHRYYNPMIGRFLGRDSTGEKGGLHLYGFVGNNSINRWDYLGMNPQSISQLLASDGLDPNGNISASSRATMQAQEAYYVGTYGRYNSGGAGTAAMVAAIPGQDQWVSVGTMNLSPSSLDPSPTVSGASVNPNNTLSYDSTPLITNSGVATAMANSTFSPSDTNTNGFFGSSNMPLFPNILPDNGQYTAQTTANGCGPAAAWNLIAAGTPDFLPTNAYSLYRNDENTAEQNGQGTRLSTIADQANSYSNGTGLSAQLTPSNTDSSAVIQQAVAGGEPFVSTQNSLSNNNHALVFIPNDDRTGATAISTTQSFDMDTGESTFVVCSWVETTAQMTEDIQNSQKGSYQVILLVRHPK